MRPETLETLEYDALLEHLARHSQSPLGRARALALEPSTDPAVVVAEIARTTEAVRFLSVRGRFGLGGLADPEPLLGRLRIAGVPLEASELLDVARFIETALVLRKSFEDVTDAAGEYPRLSTTVRALPDLSRALAEIRAKILPTGEVNESASPELRRIRREISRLRGEVQRALERLMRDRVPEAIQDEIVTIRNDRFVVPVRSEYRGRVKGVIHGSSSTGQTVFVEPLDTIDQNNELAALRDREQAEIAAILAGLTDRVRAEGDALARLVDGLAEMDFCAAKAHLAREFDCVPPAIAPDGGFHLAAARHLLLESNLRSQRAAIVPMTIDLPAESRVLVISGPNAGGKTVALKTAGLCALMAQSGLHVPAREASLPVLRQVLVDIGDHQSLAANLSTFSAHVRNISAMVEALETPALALLDEIGTGTDPDEGAAIAIAILERLRAAGAFVVVSTHYNRIKMYASRTEGVTNAAVEFDEETLRPTYRLLAGLAGSSSGIEIAKRLGLQDDVVERARGLLSATDREAAEYLKRLKDATDEANELRSALDEERAAVAKRYTELDLDFQKRERDRAAEFARALEATVKDFEAEAKRLVENAKDKTEAGRLRKAAEAGAARMRGEVRVRVQALTRKNPPPQAGQPAPRPDVPLGPIEPGAEVFVPKMGQRGTVESVEGDRVEVRMGMLKMRVGKDELERVAASPEGPAATRLPAGVRVELASDEMVDRELNLIGRTGDEARELLDKFLDEAFLGDLPEVRIIHGFGTGALKRAVTGVLSNHPHVASYAPAPSSQGGGGATVVTLRR
jgi:DNA mismatch repair protein MutS2